MYYKIAICDDDPSICRQVRQILSRHPQAGQFSISEFSSGDDLCEFLSDGGQFDLLILDILFQGSDGVELGRRLRGQLKDEITQVLYISGYEEYAMQLFDFQPINFLLKPLDEQKVLDCVDKAMRLSTRQSMCVSFAVNKISYRVPIRDIRYIERMGRKLLIHGSRAEYSYYGKLEELPQHPDLFRVHYSYFVNYNYVRAVQYEYLHMDNGAILPISRPYRQAVRDYLARRLREESGEQQEETEQ